MRAIRACQRIGALLGALACATPAAGAPAPGPAGSDAGAKSSASAASAARRLEERLTAVKAVEAEFVQTLDTPALAEPQEEAGRLYLERPGKMRWEYARPAGKLALADGKDTWLWLPEDNVAITAPLAGGERDAGVALLMQGRPDLLARFEVDWGPAPKGGARPLRLRPRRAGGPYDALLVNVDDSGFPREIVAIDPLGGRLTYRLSAVRFVDRLDPSLFSFTPPPGATVQRAAP